MKFKKISLGLMICTSCWVCGCASNEDSSEISENYGEDILQVADEIADTTKKAVLQQEDQEDQEEIDIKDPVENTASYIDTEENTKNTNLLSLEEYLSLEDYTDIEEVPNPEDKLLLVNKHYQFPDGWEPSDLVEVRNSGERQVYMRQEAAEAFEALCDWAATQGMTLNACSAYRDYDYQYNLWSNGRDNYGLEYADRYWTRPGHSEHQSGLSVDIRLNNDLTDLDAPRNYPEDYENLISNMHQFGFILRYPDDKEDITKIAPESWHFRYVGVDAATEIYEKGICLEEYLLS